MALIKLTHSGLNSAVVRNLVGERTFDLFGELTTEATEDAGGILGWAIGAGKRLTGFVLGGLARAGGLLLGTLVRWAITSVIQLATFNWNAADSEIRGWINGNNLAIAQSLGSLVGGGGVWLTTIGIATAASLKFPVLGGKVALALAEEGGEEIRGYLTSFIQSSAQALSQNALLWSYLQSRRALRSAAGMPPEVKQGAEPWIFAEQVENWAESIGGEWLRTFVENALEEAGEAAIEAGFVISYALDDYYASAKLAQQSSFGEERTVKLQPDTRVAGEFVTISGPQALIKQQVQTALTAQRWVSNRDVGQIVGQPAEDWLRAGVQRRKLTIVFKSKPAPPWTSGTERVREFTYTIPEPDLGLTWAKIKLAAKPWTWGKCRATANLENGRQMALYAATPTEAEDKIKELLELSTGKLLTLAVSEEKDRHPNLRKEPVRLYPAYATLLIRRSTAELTGTNDLSGQNFKTEHIRLELWPETEPLDTPVLL
jgi:hypothetical protein